MLYPQIKDIEPWGFWIFLSCPIHPLHCIKLEKPKCPFFSGLITQWAERCPPFKGTWIDSSHVDSAAISLTVSVTSVCIYPRLRNMESEWNWIYPPWAWRANPAVRAGSFQCSGSVGMEMLMEPGYLGAISLGKHDSILCNLICKLTWPVGDPSLCGQREPCKEPLTSGEQHVFKEGSWWYKKFSSQRPKRWAHGGHQVWDLSGGLLFCWNQSWHWWLCDSEQLKGDLRGPTQPSEVNLQRDRLPFMGSSTDTPTVAWGCRLSYF